MKGISPMIATVLLIAFTVAIGGLISVWITGMTNTQTAQVTNQSASQVKCTPSLIIDRVDSNTAGSGLLNVTYSNPSQQTITNINVSLVTATGVNNSAAGPAAIPNLASGGANFTILGPASTLPTMIKVSGLCSGLPVSASCKPADSCWRGT
jgi:flagellin-like protein